MRKSVPEVGGSRFHPMIGASQLGPPNDRRVILKGEKMDGPNRPPIARLQSAKRKGWVARIE